MLKNIDSQPQQLEPEGEAVMVPKPTPIAAATDLTKSQIEGYLNRMVTGK